MAPDRFELRIGDLAHRGRRPAALRIHLVVELGARQLTKPFRATGGAVRNALEAVGGALVVPLGPAGRCELVARRLSQFGRPEAFSADPDVARLIVTLTEYESARALPTVAQAERALALLGLAPPWSGVHGAQAAEVDPDSPLGWLAATHGEADRLTDDDAPRTISDVVSASLRGEPVAGERARPLTAAQRGAVAALLRQTIDARIDERRSAPRVLALEGAWRGLARATRELERIEEGWVDAWVVPLAETSPAGALSQAWTAPSGPPDIAFLDVPDLTPTALAECAALAGRHGVVLVARADVASEGGEEGLGSLVAAQDRPYTALVANDLLLRSDPCEGYRCYAAASLGVAYLLIRGFPATGSLRCSGLVGDLDVAEEKTGAPALRHSLSESDHERLAQRAIGAWIPGPQGDDAALSRLPSLAGSPLDVALLERYAARRADI